MVDGFFDIWRTVPLITNGTSAGAAGSLLPTGSKPQIPSVDWWITSRCNLGCDFCYGPVPGADSIERRGEILEALAASSARAVTFCGGEPLLVNNVGRYSAALRKRGKSTVLNTNGQLLRRCLDRKDRKVRLTDFSVVGISVDGSTPAVHRQMRGPNADLHEVLTAVRLVRYQSGVKLKIGTVVSGVNREDLPALAALVNKVRPDVWRLYQYSSRGDQNVGQQRHRLSDQDFRILAKEAAYLAAPVWTVPSTETATAGCLIVDPAGNVLQPTGADYVRHGNCLDEPLDRIWARIPGPSRETIADNKRWLSVLD